MVVKLREMEVLHAVVKTGSMSAAARQLHTSQPAVSQAVRALEDRLDVVLFSREGNSIAPTPELLELFNELDVIFTGVETARRLAGGLRQGAGRVLRLGAIPSLMQAFMPRAIHLLRQAYPLVRVWVRSQEPTSVRDAVVRREFDLGVIFAEMKREGIDVLDLCSAPIVCLMREDDPLAKQAYLEPRTLAGQPLISHAEWSPIGESLDTVFAQHDVSRLLAVEVGNSYGSTHFVRSGLGIALIDPFFLGTTDLTGLAVRSFRPTRILTPRLVHVNGHKLSKIEDHFLKCLRTAAEEWRVANAEFLASGD